MTFAQFILLFFINIIGSIFAGMAAGIYIINKGEFDEKKLNEIKKQYYGDKDDE